MAVRGSDGSIILTVEIDKASLEGEINTIKGKTKSIKSAAESTGQSFKRLGSYIATAFSVKTFINFSREAGQMATQQEANIQRLIDIYGEASKEVGMFIDSNARALGMSKSAAASFSAVYGNLFSVWADQNTNAQLTAQYLNMTAVVASKTGRTVEDVQERVRSGLLGNTEAIEDLGVFVNIKTIEMTDAFKRMANGKSWEQLGAYQQQQIRTMAILEQATQKYGNTVENTTALTRARYKAAYEDMKATWGQFVNVVLMPVLSVATKIMDVITAGMRAIAGITGKTIEDTQNISSSIGGAADNQKALTEETKKTAKEQKKLLAGFDDIQILSQNAAEGAGSSSGTVGGGSVTDLGLTDSNGGGQEEGISAMLAAIMGVVGGAMVAIGVLLLFHGQIGWGIGFIIAGAATMGVSMAALSKAEGGEGAIRMLTTIMGVVGSALIAIGIMLLYLGVGTLPVAIGMIIAGSASLIGAVGAMATFSPEDVRGWLSLIMGIAGGALLALGIILCMVGSTPIGVGMIIAGSVALVSAVALNFNSVTDKIKGWVAVIMAIAGAALLVLGIILCATGAGVALGIALIMAGAVAFVTPIALNWNAIVDWVKKAWNAVKEFWNAYIAPIFTKEWWLNLAKKVGNGLLIGFEKAINGIIGMFEKMINWIVNGLNKIKFDVPDWVPGIGGKSFGFNIPPVKFNRVSIPRLARGAVIPPNREFLAVLGDQKQGTNIEAPAELIKQMAMEALLEVGMTGQTTKEEHYYLNETELMSIIYKLVKGGERLKGNSLISGGAY